MLRALIPSPYVGPGSMRRLERCGSDMKAVDYGGVAGPDWYEGAAHRIAEQVDDTPWIAVLHSGAGGFAPALAATADNLRGFVFLDAILPHPGKSIVDGAPAPFVQGLSELTKDGRLAPWNTWFEHDPVSALIADANEREQFVADLPCTPFAYLEAKSPDTAKWEARRAAYVQLSRTYTDTANAAEARGWPVRRARLNHLAMTTDPQAVFDLLTGLP